MDTLAVVGIQVDTMVGEDTQADTLAMEEDTQADTMVMEGTQGVITPVRGIIPVGTAVGGIGIIPAVIGGVRVGGGLIRMSIHIPITTPLTILIPIPIPIPILIICLRRRSPESLPHMASSRNNLTTGITARIRRDTTPMSKVVREAGYR